MNEAHRRAVFLMLAGENVAEVSEEFKICRTGLYKLRRRATDAVRREIERPTKNKNPGHNRIPQEKEDKIVRLCQRHTALSSYGISRKFQQPENETTIRELFKESEKDILCRAFPKDRLRHSKLIASLPLKSSSFGKL